MDNFPFLRITMLGASGSGKTSIINSFLNKNILTGVFPTEIPQVYYKCVRLPPDGDEKGERRSVMIEIEDTFGSERSDGGRDVELFMDMTRNQLASPSGVDDFTPFNIWKPSKFRKGKLECLTQGRMGFMICFDCRSPSSWEEAVRIHVILSTLAEKDVRRARTPVMFLVANKIEQPPANEEPDRGASIITLAELYVQRSFMRLWKVSALEGKNVTVMFRDMLHLVIGNTGLWEVEYFEKEEEEPKENECSIL